LVRCGVCFTLAGAAFGFAANVYKDLQFQTQVSADMLAYWGAIRDVSFFVSIVLAVLGVMFWGKSKYRLHQIKKSTKFND
jgi:hypothetical protein